MVLRNTLAGGILTLLAGCSGLGPMASSNGSFQDPKRASEVSLSRQSGVQARLHSLYWPLASAAKDHCRDRSVYSIGAILASQQDYPLARQDEANRTLGLDERARFTDVLAQSPAARAGILPGDILLAVNLQPSSTWAQALNAAQTSNGGLRLSLERDTQRIETVVRPESHCVSGVFTELDSAKPRSITFPLAFVEQMEDVPLKGALAWRIAQLALTDKASVAQIDELAATLLQRVNESIETLWSVRSSQANVARMTSFDLAPMLGLPASEMDLAIKPPSPTISTALPAVPLKPSISEAGLAAYQRYANRPLPKAFVTSANGGWAAAWGRPDALEHAMNLCQRDGGQQCSAFAIDSTVVVDR